MLVLSVFGLGLVMGGVASATLLLLVGQLMAVPVEAAIVVLTIVTIVCVLRDSRLLEFRLPQNARQVDRSVFLRGEVLGTLQFGFEMGTCVRTYISSSAPYILAIGLVLAVHGSWLALSCGVAFGVGRWLMIITRNASDSRRLWDHRLSASEPWLVPLLTGTTGACIVAPLIRV